MEKRILLASALSMLVLLGFRYFLEEPQTPAPAPVAQATSPIPAAPTVEPQAPPREPAVTPRSGVVVPPVSVSAQTEERVAIETEAFQIVFSNRGATLQSFRLKKYTDARGLPIELIDQRAGAKVGWPLRVRTESDPEADKALQESLYAVSRESQTVVAFEYSGSGLRSEKRFEVHPDGYSVKIASRVFREGQPVAHWVEWAAGVGDQSIPFDVTHRNFLHFDEGFVRVHFGSAETDPQEVLSTRVGLEDQYFLALVGFREAVAVRYSAATLDLGGGSSVSLVGWQAPVPRSGELDLYIGPKERVALSKAGPDLSGVLDYGMFEVITVPLLMALFWLYGYIGNYGWAIIVLTVAINLVLFPLRLKQQLSMAKMQKIQPQMKALQDKYKKLKPTDPKRQEVQTEMMGLYKLHGVNPMGGCLPLLLQMPFLFAFWSMLSVAIELRRAPWILWIQDLSQYDPYYITPVFMAVSMIVMQKMTPTAMDPAQAKIMLFMPVVFSVMFLWVQSGLMLYWLTSNVVGIGQQYAINRFWSAPVEVNGKSGRKRE